MGACKRLRISLIGNSFGYDVGGSFTAALGFEIRPATELRIRGKLTYSFPGFEPSALPELSEMFFDYSVLDAVFFRIGIFDYTWGNSQFFQFGNLPARKPAGVGRTQHAALVGADQPAHYHPHAELPGVPQDEHSHGLQHADPSRQVRPPELRESSHGDIAQPQGRRLIGIEYDLVTGPIEWSLAGYYQWQLNPRTLLALKTSILGFDVSAEGTLASPVSINRFAISSDATPGGGIYVGGALQYIYPTAVVGVSREWTDAGIKVYAEYGYNGERAPGESWLLDASGPGGHNSAMGARFTNLNGSGMTLNVLWQQNWSDGSGLVAPFIEFSPVGLASVQVGIPYLWGARTSEVASNRLVPGSQGVELLILVKISQSFRQ